jgi:hypothetical protein
MMADRTVAAVEVQPDEVELHCPKCGGFVVAVGMPERPPMTAVEFMVRCYCKRCSRRFVRRITFAPKSRLRPEPPMAADGPALDLPSVSALADR